MKSRSVLSGVVASAFLLGMVGAALAEEAMKAKPDATMRLQSKSVAAGVGFSNLPQFAPAPGTVDNRAPQGFSRSGMQVCLGDGSVRVVTSGISQEAWNWACNPDDPNPPPADW